ncbi:hypothetical protein TWF281_007365 [Arthrobotrys megalospora]
MSQACWTPGIGIIEEPEKTLRLIEQYRNFGQVQEPQPVLSKIRAEGMDEGVGHADVACWLHVRQDNHAIADGDLRAESLGKTNR